MTVRPKTYKGITKDTQRLLASPESAEAEFKESLGGLDASDLVAFANNRGGTILIGVEERKTDAVQRGRVIGCRVGDRESMAIATKAASCRPQIEVEVTIENTSRTPFFRVDIREGKDKPYATQSGTYKIRADGHNRSIDPSHMRSLILELEAESFVRRFREAADAVISEIQSVHDSLAEDIAAVRDAAERAGDAADEARRAAEEAQQAAEAVEPQ